MTRWQFCCATQKRSRHATVCQAVLRLMLSLRQRCTLSFTSTSKTNHWPCCRRTPRRIAPRLFGVSQLVSAFGFSLCGELQAEATTPWSSPSSATTTNEQRRRRLLIHRFDSFTTTNDDKRTATKKKKKNDDERRITNNQQPTTTKKHKVNFRTASFTAPSSPTHSPQPTARCAQPAQRAHSHSHAKWTQTNKQMNEQFGRK